MKHILLLSKSYLRKGKLQTISFLVILLFAALLLNMGIVTLLNFGNNFDKRSELLNSEDSLSLMLKKDYKEEYLDFLKNDERVKDYEVKKVIFTLSSMSYGGGDLTLSTVFMNISDTDRIGKSAIVKKSDVKYDNGVYLPLSFHTGGGYEFGDTIDFTIGIKPYHYRVAGFYENMFLASTNTGSVGILLEETDYRKLQDDLAQAWEGIAIKVQCVNREEAKVLTAEYQSYISKNAESQLFFNNNDYGSVKQARTVTAGIGSALVVSFSFIIAIVGIIIIRFRVNNNIDEDMKNIGVLKAMGYQSKQIIVSIMVQFLSIGLVSVLAGIGLSYLLLPVLALSYEAQSGIPWKQGFDMYSTILTTGIILGSVAFMSYVSSSRIKKIYPLTALRNNILTHNFTKNYFPLAGKGRQFISLMAFKSLFQRKKQNIMMILIFIAVGFTCSFAEILYYNIVKEDKAFLSIAGEIADAGVYLNTDMKNNDIKEEIALVKGVRKVIYYDQKMLETEGVTVYSYISEDYELTESSLLFDGRHPKHNNEVAIGGKMASDLDKHIGESMQLTYGGKTEEYLITGLLQSANNMGYDMEITLAGIKELYASYEPGTLYVYLDKNFSMEKFTDYMSGKYTSEITSIMDIDKMINSQMGAYKQIVSLFSVVILFITAVLITLILSLVIRTVIIQKQKYLGIQKALGFTSRQLITQLLYEFLPVTIIGIIAGGIAGYFFINPILSVLFFNIGMVKMRFIMKIDVFVMVTVGIIIYSFIMTLVLSMRIKKISAYQLITE
ncbi:MAG: transporter permease [Anaerocolumna sp.]|jgi:putative ABC transport system permease protein|nr:transporter permease [Anaerocolumna sp.]